MGVPFRCKGQLIVHQLRDALTQMNQRVQETDHVVGLLQTLKIYIYPKSVQHNDTMLILHSFIDATSAVAAN
jgi:oligoribonuclease (3'-5' exoribonuclease)